jgi:hypothetical protein
MIEREMSKSVLPAVKKSVNVNLSLEDAFRLFTEGIHSWWPLASHSVGAENADSCVLEQKQGGRIYELLKDGSQSDWGQILLWEAPHRFIMSWHPGRESSTAQEVELVFTAGGNNTRVDLIHRNWEILGIQAAATRHRYIEGWDYVLGLYVEQAKGD